MKEPDPDFPATHSMDTTWFAVDEEGCVGIFDSGENAPVPERYMFMYGQLSDDFPKALLHPDPHGQPLQAADLLLENDFTRVIVFESGWADSLKLVFQSESDLRTAQEIIYDSVKNLKDAKHELEEGDSKLVRIPMNGVIAAHVHHLRIDALEQLREKNLARPSWFMRMQRIQSSPLNTSYANELIGYAASRPQTCFLFKEVEFSEMYYREWNSESPLKVVDLPELLRPHAELMRIKGVRFRDKPFFQPLEHWICTRHSSGPWPTSDGRLYRWSKGCYPAEIDLDIRELYRRDALDDPRTIDGYTFPRDFDTAPWEV